MDTQDVERIRAKLAKRDTLREQGNGYPPFGQQTHEQMEATMSRHYELIETVFLDAEVQTLLRIIDRQQGVIQAARAAYDDVEYEVSQHTRMDFVSALVTWGTLGRELDALAAMEGADDGDA